MKRSVSSPSFAQLTPAVLAAALSPPDVGRAWLEVTAQLRELMPKLVRVDASALGATAQNRLGPGAPRSERALADRVARAFGDPRFDLLVDAASVGVPKLVASDPPVVILPRGFGDLPQNEQAIGIGRLLVYLALGVPWLEDVGADDLEGLLFGALRAGQENWNEGKLTPASAANAEVWRPRIVKAASRKQRRALEELAEKHRDYADPQRFRQAVRALSMRAGFLLTRDLTSTLNHLVRIDRELSQAPRREVAQKLWEHSMARELVFYALVPG